MKNLSPTPSDLECNLVMKGGITSGVIYPKLIARLSDTYRLRSIGGTSAGAIAAAAAAAAQLGKHAGTNAEAFKRLENLPDELAQRVENGRGSVLLNLFQPQRSLARHFSLLTAALNAPSKLSLIRRVATAIIPRFPMAALLGAAPGILLLFRSWGVGWFLSLFVTLVGAVATAMFFALRSFGQRLPGNFFGLCNGMPASAGAAPAALTPWLHAYLNELAGKQGNAPLTFGELWRGSIRPDVTATEGERTKEEDKKNGPPPVIELAMMTTALNLGRPYRIPFDTDGIYYIEEELKNFFPDEVMRWMVDHVRESKTADLLSRPDSTFRAFPRTNDFPVIVGVRLSLSFPVLLSALPLYMVDHTLDVNKGEATQATRVYFSDGGISSNFPVHFFDDPLPSRPTFGVNLRGFHPDHPTERVFLPPPLHNNSGLKNYCPPLRDGPGLGSIFAFLGSIASTEQNWRDQLSLSAPGFRDRIVHISHSESEGGLNLNMPECTITTLANSGVEAANILIKTFADREDAETPNGWDNHMRIRARVLLNALQKHIDLLAEALEEPLDPSYDQAVTNKELHTYPFSNEVDVKAALKLLNDLNQISLELRNQSVDFNEDAPDPAPEIHIVPRM
jgi:predicted acylesterase/phospholipase RssA